jgi:hypothetical protein
MMASPTWRGLAAASLLLLVGADQQEPRTTVDGCRQFRLVVPLPTGPVVLACNWSGGATYFRCTRPSPAPRIAHPQQSARGCGNPLGE